MPEIHIIHAGHSMSLAEVLNLLTGPCKWPVGAEADKEEPEVAISVEDLLARVVAAAKRAADRQKPNANTDPKGGAPESPERESVTVESEFNRLRQDNERLRSTVQEFAAVNDELRGQVETMERALKGRAELLATAHKRSEALRGERDRLARRLHEIEQCVLGTRPNAPSQD